MTHEASTKRRLWRRIRRVGCGSLVLITTGLACFVAFNVGLAPKFVYDFPERFLPPYCDEQLFASIVEKPPSEMRVVSDLYGKTRVIAVDSSGEDVCFFRASTHPSAGFWPATSPDIEYVAFVTNQFVSTYDWIHHLFIVDRVNGTYHHISSADKSFEDLTWSPDGRHLAYTSYSGTPGWWQNTYIGLLSADAEVIWQVDLGTENPYYWGYIEWVDEGNRLRYGHDEESVMGKPLPQPFWCTVDNDGSDLGCELLEGDT